MPDQTPATGPRTDSSVAFLVDRPREQRLREYQYRFAQSAVFGLPVLALQLFGRSLGGAEAGRWVALLQALLAGWIMYVGAAGMLFEGLFLLSRRRLAWDLIPAIAAAGFYAVGLWRTGALLAGDSTGVPSPGFHWAVLTVMVWTCLRWWSMRTKATGGLSRN